jgi:hypothetical protein
MSTDVSIQAILPRSREVIRLHSQFTTTPYIDN